MDKRQHPYRTLPAKAFWKRSVAEPARAMVDPVGRFDLRIDAQSRVATAGSCFAQHIARHLRQSGFTYYIAEEGHPLLPQSVKDKHHYGTFSARYGNIYTARQLLQLFQRAYGEFRPAEQPWIEADGRVLDPFRPTVQPGGYASVAEMEADREQHLRIVRTMFETLDVFVFTLGLTECWVSRQDGAAFPLCPGVEGGIFDAEKYAFLNQDVNQVQEDMRAFIAGLKRVNPAAHVVLTVSPVPLMATAEPEEHVLTATTYSKSVLRVAAGMLEREHEHVHYFPSYEIITGGHVRGAYFASDLRSVVEEGVDHVMRLFLKHATGGTVSTPAPTNPATEEGAVNQAAQALVDVECDESALDRS